MSVYLMAAVNVKDHERYGEYVSRAFESVKKYGVEVLALSDAPVSLEGRSPYRRYVLMCRSSDLI